MKIFDDRPIEFKKDDSLNRASFADTVADYLLSPVAKEGFVVSINGPLGCGKTSIVNMVKEHLRSNLVSKDNLTIPIFVDFSPWNATSQSQLINQFLNVLSDSFKGNKVIKAIDVSLDIISKMTDLPSLPSSIKTIIKSVDSAFKKYRHRGRNKKEEKDKIEYPLYSNDLCNHAKKGDAESFIKDGNGDNSVLDQIKVCSRIAHTKEILLKAAVISIIAFTICLVALIICLASF